MTRARTSRISRTHNQSKDVSARDIFSPKLSDANPDRSLEA